MKNDNKKLLWDMFESTGQIGYYLLYNKMNDKQHDTNGDSFKGNGL